MTWQDTIRNPTCTDCGLHEHAQYVCLMGTGKRSSKLMIVGEAPGAREDERHAAFVGPAGQLLTELLREVHIERRDCYITNAVKCRPRDNTTPSRQEVKACNGYLLQEVQAIRPEYILAVGNTALQALTSRSGITKYRGKLFPLGERIRVLGTFHPAAALRSPRYLPAIRADLQALKRYMDGRDTEQPSTAVRIIRNQAQLRWLIGELNEAKTIAFDLETTGLDEFAPTAQIVSVGFAWEEGRAAVVPLHHAQATFRDPMAVLALLKPTLERDGVRYVGHNAKFDARWLGRFGVYVPVTFDTMLASHLLDENGQHGLKPLSQIHLGASDYDIGDDVKDAYNAPLKRLCIYNGKDCDYTLKLYNLFKERLKEEPRLARLYLKLTMPAARTLTKVEATGMWVDPQRMKERTFQAEHKFLMCQNFMRMYLPTDKPNINFNSPQQVGAWLFGDLKLPILEETAKGMPSTREAVLLQLAKQSKPVAALLKYRKWAKYLSTYLRPWKEQVDQRGRLHTSYLLHGTVTGRLSSRGPNLQQVPRDPFIRSIIGAPPGWVFVEADYSQVELRIAAMIANERNMLRAFATGEDIHMKTACEMTGKSPADVTSEERKKAKAVNFGFLYGMGAAKFVIYARDNYDVEVSLAEAERTRDRFFESYPRLRSWHDRQRRLAERYGRVQSPLGRIRHLPDMQSSDRDVRAESERQAINSPVQSMASDLMLVSLTRLGETLPSNTARVVGTVHDAILFEVRVGAEVTVLPTIENIMTDVSYVKKAFGTDITVPIEVEIKVSTHWGESS